MSLFSTVKNPVMGGGRVRDDMYLGSSQQDYLTHVELRTANGLVVEARRAAEHVSLTLLRETPRLSPAQHLIQAKEILVQLGLLDVLAPAAAGVRAA